MAGKRGADGAVGARLAKVLKSLCFMRNFHRALETFAVLLSLPSLILSGCSAGHTVPTQERTLRTIRVAVMTPNPCWNIKITEVYLTPDEIWVVSELKAPQKDTMCIQVIGTAKDQIQLKLAASPIRHFILGRTWGREYGDPQREPGMVYVYPSSRDEIDGMLKRARRTFPKKTRKRRHY